MTCRACLKRIAAIAASIEEMALSLWPTEYERRAAEGVTVQGGD